MTERELEYFLAFSRLNPRKKLHLLEEMGTAGAVWRLRDEELRVLGLTENEIDLWNRRKREEKKWRKEWESLPERGIRFVTVKDPDYPGRLSELSDRPFGLLYKGRLPDERRPSAAVIGTRLATPYGLKTAEEAGRVLSSRGIQVISGMALGIDGASHRGALGALAEDPEAGGTYAVFGCGIEACYPREHEDLYAMIPERGGLISEMGLFDPPVPVNFPARNRVLAGLSDVVIVVEAKKKSGSFLTVDHALNQGKDVLAVPGRIGDELSAGCNTLIASGATIVRSVRELPELCSRQMTLADWARTEKRERPHRPAAREKPGKTAENGEKKAEGAGKDLPDGLATQEKLLYSILDSNPKHREEIAALTGLSTGELAAALLNLEIGGWIKRSNGNYYHRT